MWHTRRVWGVVRIPLDEVAAQLHEHTWTLCQAFETPGGAVWANDSTSADALQEFAVLRRIEGQWRQVESITVSWCSIEVLADLLRKVDAGEFDDERPLGAVADEQLDREHEVCELCA